MAFHRTVIDRSTHAGVVCDPGECGSPRAAARPHSGFLPVVTAVPQLPHDVQALDAPEVLVRAHEFGSMYGCGCEDDVVRRVAVGDAVQSVTAPAAPRSPRACRVPGRTA
jgi:hypothetical protein